jgi:hypothetical protein
MTLIPGEVEYFREVQPMHRNALIRYVLPVEAVVVTGIIVPIAFTVGQDKQLELLIVWIVAAVLLPAWIAFGLRLTTIVTDRRVVARFPPFAIRSIDLSDIESAEAIKYSPLMDAGGWGIRYSMKMGAVLNVSGDRGVHVHYRTGEKTKRLLLGSERCGELADAIHRATG